MASGEKLAQEPLGLVPGQEFVAGLGEICDLVLKSPEVAGWASWACPVGAGGWHAGAWPGWVTQHHPYPYPPWGSPRHSHPG